MGAIKTVYLNVDNTTWKQFRKQLRKQGLGTVRGFFLKKMESVLESRGDREDIEGVMWVKFRKIGDRWMVVP